MPTEYVKKLADKKGMSVTEAEKKWDEAKNAVDKSEHDSDESYYAKVTSVFKKMMGEQSFPGTVLSFEDYIIEFMGFSRSERDANRQMGNHSPNTAHVQSIKHTNPYASVDKKVEQRKQEVHGAAMQHVRRGDHKSAFDAAYKAAHAHATEDRYGPEAAHEIATRKAKHAVKTAQNALSR